jgi:UDP-glucose 4-epimerase
MPGRVLVTGATGFVGRNVVNLLKEKGHDSIATDITPNCFPDDVHYARSDILDPEKVDVLTNDVDAIIHLAASPLVVSLEKPMENMKVNLEGTLNLLESCRKKDVDLLIFSSASSVVGELKYNPVDEEHPCVPKTPYAAAKLASEEYIRVYGEIYGLRYLVFRFFNVYGPWQYPESGGLIPSILNRMVNGDSITIFGDGSATRDFIYSVDVAKFCADALEKGIHGGILNMGTGKGTSISAIVQLASEVTGIKPNIERKPARKGEIDNFYADVKNLQQTFGSAPSTPVKDGLNKTYEWLKEECL